MKRLALVFPALAALLLGALACGEVSTPPLPGAGTAVPSAVPAVTPDWPAEAQALVDLASADLAKRLGVPPADIAVVEVETVVWPDGCLGCPAPGQRCTDALVPGYRVLLSAAGQEYEYRTDRASRVLLCPNPTDNAVREWGAAQPLVDLVSADLAGRLGVDPRQITVVSVEERQWSDSSMGCPQPGMAYLTVITPGYQIVLQVGDRQYDYHTGPQSRFVLCEK